MRTKWVHYVYSQQNLLFRIFVTGGQTETGNTTNSVEMFDVENPTQGWSMCASMIEMRRNHAIIAYDNNAFVFGGYNGSSRVASCEK